MQGVSHLRIVTPEELEKQKDREDNESPRKSSTVHGSSPHSKTPKQKPKNGLTEAQEELEREKYADLIDAINNGKVDDAKSLVKKYPNLVNRDDEVEGFTALMTAIAYEDDNKVAIELTTMLLEAGAPRLKADKRGNIALHWAARLGRVDLLDMVIEGDSDIGIRNRDGNTVLHLASRFGQLRCCQYFLKRVASESGEKMEEKLRNWKSRREIGKSNIKKEKAFFPETENDSTINQNTDSSDVKLNNGEVIKKEAEGDENSDDKDAEDYKAKPKRNPGRAARSKSTPKEQTRTKAKKGPENEVEFSLPEEQMQNEDVPIPLLLERNRKGETPFDLAAERLDVEELNIDEAEELIKKTREKIQKEFFKYSSFFKTLVLHHQDCFEHVPVNEHDKNVWEAPERLKAILGSLKGIEKDMFLFSSDFEAVSRETIEMAHSKEYVDFVYKLSEEIKDSDPVPFTPRVQREVGMVEEDQIKKDDICDTSFSKGSLRAATRACGAVCHSIDRVMCKLQRNSFCIVRPPGHHAGIDGLLEEASSCGFCIFNNVAIGALHALKKYSDTVRRVAIIDFDVHHGNGTEEIVAKYNREHGSERSHMMFFSSHLYDGARPGSKYEFYPGSGKDNNLYGNIINVPMQPLWRRRGIGKNSRKTPAEKFYLDHHGRTEFRRIVSERLLPALRAYEPDLILLSAGFDAGRRDVGNGRFTGRYCSGFNLQQQDFAWVASQVSVIANLCCEGRIISVLEGGYGRPVHGSKIDRSSLARNTCAHILGLIDPQLELDPDSSESEASDTEYDEQGRVMSTDGEKVGSRGSRTRRKPKRFEAEADRSHRSNRKSISKGMKEGIRSSSNGQSSKKRNRETSASEDSSSSSSSSESESPPRKEKLKKENANRERDRKKGKSKQAKSAIRKESSKKALKAKAEEKETLSKKAEKKAEKKEKKEAKMKAKEKKEKEKKEKQQVKETKKRKTQKKDEGAGDKRQDALEYLQQVKTKFAKEPSVYRGFLTVMGEFKKNKLDVDQVIEKVKEMFTGDRKLIEGFNTFLPPGFTIEYDEPQTKLPVNKAASDGFMNPNVSSIATPPLPLPAQNFVPVPVVVPQLAPPVAASLGGQSQGQSAGPQTENILPVDSKTGLPAGWQKQTTPIPGSNSMGITYVAPNGVWLKTPEDLERFCRNFSEAKWIVNQLRNTIVFPQFSSGQGSSSSGSK